MKISVQFAKRRSEVIEHLALSVMPGNAARAENLFRPYIDKIITELNGVVTVIEKNVGNQGVTWKQRCVTFPDGSQARMPTLDDLRKAIQ